MKSLPTYPSMAACSKATGIPLAALKKAKRDACDAFSGAGAIDLGKLLRWVFSEGEETDMGIDWIREKAKTQTLRERIKLAQDERNVIDRDEVSAGIKAGVALLFSDLERIFASELPPVLKGLDELSIRAKALQEIETMKASLRQKFADMENVKSIE